MPTITIEPKLSSLGTNRRCPTSLMDEEDWDEDLHQEDPDEFSKEEQNDFDEEDLDLVN